MDRSHRELLGPGGLVLDVRGRTGLPPLRFECAPGGRVLLRQGDRPVILGREEEGGCSREGLFVHRLAGYRSPLPRIRSAWQRRPGNWVHRYARWLEEAPQDGPLHEGRWHLGVRDRFPAYVWSGDFLRDWPGGHLDWCAGGWEGVVPLRELSPEDDPRVKAYRKHAREGTLAPVLLWQVTLLDGWVILDGHDRAVAALAEGRTPPCVVLIRAPGEEDWRRTADEVSQWYEDRLARLAARPGAEPERQTMLRSYGDTVSGLPYEVACTRTWALPGGAPAWDALATAAMFQFPSD
ncbi:hypothetical protein [Streptomyces griseochromogenes]|uniref:hypothetical protein n=1 Tax=Streptomyces griseochromogenes TaxID=68214 RepID=UPI0037A499AE